MIVLLSVHFKNPWHLFLCTRDGCCGDLDSDISSSVNSSDPENPNDTNFVKLVRERDTKCLHSGNKETPEFGFRTRDDTTVVDNSI